MKPKENKLEGMTCKFRFSGGKRRKEKKIDDA
jgi:hypothetical protein